MKPTFSFSFLLLFFTTTKLTSLASSSQVIDGFDEPVTPGNQYFLMSSIYKHGGGVKPGVSDQYSTCPVDVIQVEYTYISDHFGKPVNFTIPSKSPSPSDSSNILMTGHAVEIGFTEKPGCVESSTWAVFSDSGGKSWVGIGGLKDHVRAEKVVSGSFKMEEVPRGILRLNTYKLVFCEEDSNVCSDVGIEYKDKTRRLVLGAKSHFRFNIFHTEINDDGNKMMNHENIKQVVDN